MGKVHRVDYDHRAFLLGIMGMDAFDIGVYWVICSLIYESEGPISENDERIFKIIGSKRDAIKRAIGRLTDGIHPKLTRFEGDLSNKRAEIELESAQNRIENAKKAASSRWDSKGGKQENQDDGDATAKSRAMPYHTNHTNTKPAAHAGAAARRGAAAAPSAEGFEPQPADAELNQWIGRCKAWAKSKTKWWNTGAWGPAPNEPGCKVPAKALDAAGIAKGVQR